MLPVLCRCWLAVAVLFIRALDRRACITHLSLHTAVCFVCGFYTIELRRPQLCTVLLLQHPPQEHTLCCCCCCVHCAAAAAFTTRVCTVVFRPGTDLQTRPTTSLTESPNPQATAQEPSSRNTDANRRKTCQSTPHHVQLDAISLYPF